MILQKDISKGKKIKTSIQNRPIEDSVYSGEISPPQGMLISHCKNRSGSDYPTVHVIC